MRPVDAVIWICVAIFAATGVITLLALVNGISLGRTKEEHNYYLRRLFLLLIVQVAGSATAGFAIYMKESVVDSIRKEVTAEAGGTLVNVQKQFEARLIELERKDQHSGTQRQQPNWVLVNAGDCDGHDVGRSIGPSPKADNCVPGLTAVCWDQQLFRNGNSPEPWCTYKNVPASSCKGGSARGKVFECTK